MKKLILASAVLVALATVSCKKKYECSFCGDDLTGTEEVKAKNDVDAALECASAGCSGFATEK